MCANTQTAAIGRAKASFSIRHTGGARAAVQEARTALGLSWRYIEAFEAEAAALFAQPMDAEQVHRFAEKLVDVEGAESTASARKHSERPKPLRAGPGNCQTLDLVHHSSDRG
jgi:Domain of unknown function (DUF932)